MNWLTVPDFPNYEVSDHGTVRNRRTGRVLKQWKVSPAGFPHLTYMKTALWKNNARKHFFVHRLVLMVFFGPGPEGCPDVCHRNHDSHDNRLANLAWGSRLDNVRDAFSREGVEARRDIQQDRAIFDEANGAELTDCSVAGVPF